MACIWADSRHHQDACLPAHCVIQASAALSQACIQSVVLLVLVQRDTFHFLMIGYGRRNEMLLSVMRSFCHPRGSSGKVFCAQGIDAQDMKTCDTDEGGCGQLNPIQRFLEGRPSPVFTVQLAWESHAESTEAITEVLNAVQEVRLPEAIMLCPVFMPTACQARAMLHNLSLVSCEEPAVRLIRRPLCKGHLLMVCRSRLMSPCSWIHLKLRAGLQMFEYPASNPFASRAMCLWTV